MKLSKSSSSTISYVMGISITIITMIAFIFIAIAMKNVYLQAMDDMTNIAIHNIDEHISMHQNEMFVLTKLQSFINLEVCQEEMRHNTNEYEAAFSGTFNYISKKTENSNSIKKITITDKNNRVLLSNFANEIDTTIPDDSPYLDNLNENICTASIQKNSKGENIILVAQPIKLYSKPTGYVFMELNFDIIDSLMQNYRFGDSGSLFFITNTGSVVGNNLNAVPHTLNEIKDNPHITSLLQSKPADGMRTFTSEYKCGANNRYVVYSYVSSIDAIIATSVEKSEVNQTAFTTAFPLMFLLIVIFILLFTYKYIISTKILHPLSLLNRSLYMLKKGDLRARYNYNADNEFGNLSTVFNQTIASLQQTTQSLKEREAKSNIILENITDVVWEYDIDSKTIKLPENWSMLIGVEYAEPNYLYSIETFVKFIHINYSDEFVTSLADCIEQKRPMNCECRIKKQNNEYFWAKINGSCMYNVYDEPHKVFGSIFDITDMKTRENSLQDSAKRDDMTKLLKKIEMERIVNIDLQQNSIGHSMMILDLDGFKGINDTYGHLIGDEIIIYTANTLKLLCGYDCDICRFGGDEFIVYVKKVYTLDETTQLAECIIETLNRGYDASNGEHIKLCCSIGISRSPRDGATYVELMTKADLAIYNAKRHEKNKYVLYSPEMK